MVFSVHVTWRQLPRYGPSSPKRLEQQGRQFCEPACKKTWGKVKCISLLSIRQPLPNQTCLSTARQRYQLQQQNTSTIFTRRGHHRQLGLELVAAWATSYRDRLGIGEVVNCLETAEPVRSPTSNACLVINRREDLRHQVQEVASRCPRRFRAT